MTHNPAPWGEDLATLIKAGDERLSVRGMSVPVDCRLIAEGNFQFAKHRVNCHEALVASLAEAEELIKQMMSHEGAEGWSASLSDRLDCYHFGRALKQAEEFGS